MVFNLAVATRTWVAGPFAGGREKCNEHIIVWFVHCLFLQLTLGHWKYGGRGLENGTKHKWVAAWKNAGSYYNGWLFSPYIEKHNQDDSTPWLAPFAFFSFVFILSVSVILEFYDAFFG